jgi:hypothetical protein
MWSYLQRTPPTNVIYMLHFQQQSTPNHTILVEKNTCSQKHDHHQSCNGQVRHDFHAQYCYGRSDHLGRTWRPPSGDTGEACQHGHSLVPNTHGAQRGGGTRWFRCPVRRGGRGPHHGSSCDWLQQRHARKWMSCDRL